MALALFDLDHTLINGDSDSAWGIFLADIGAVDRDEHTRRQHEYYAQYLQGTLDIDEFLSFQLSVLKQYPLKQLLDWRAQFVDQVIEPMIESGKAELIEPHRQKGDELLIITATSDFVTRPIADRLGVSNLIATTAEQIGGQYTGRATDTPCYGEGKVTRLKRWLQDHPHDMRDSTFYSDSHNDIPLLVYCDNPVAVTPDEKLRQHAEMVGWPIID